MGEVMKKEIEVKIKLDLKQTEALHKWLSANSQDLGTREITDYYLNQPKNTFYVVSKKGFNDPLEFVRVRKTKNKNFVCYKKRMVDENGHTVQVEELDLEISGAPDFLSFFKKLGFTQEVVIKKNRHTFLFDHKFEVVFDDVENLGKFVEIEIKNFDGTVEAGINEIYDFLRAIGIKEFISFDRGYLCMMLNPKYDFGKQVTI